MSTVWRSTEELNAFPAQGVNLDELEKRGRDGPLLQEKRLVESENESFLGPLCRREDKKVVVFLI